MQQLVFGRRDEETDTERADKHAQRKLREE